MPKIRLLVLCIFAFICCVIGANKENDEDVTIGTLQEDIKNDSESSKNIAPKNTKSALARLFLPGPWTPIIFLASSLLGMLITRMFDESPLSPLPVRPLPNPPVGKNPPHYTGGAAAPVELVTFPWPYYYYGYGRSFAKTLDSIENFLSKAMKVYDTISRRSTSDRKERKFLVKRQTFIGETLAHFIRSVSDFLKEEFGDQGENQTEICELDSSDCENSS